MMDVVICPLNWNVREKLQEMQNYLVSEAIKRT